MSMHAVDETQQDYIDQKEVPLTVIGKSKQLDIHKNFQKIPEGALEVAGCAV